MQVRLEYGRTGLDAQVPDGPNVQILSYGATRPLDDPTAELCRVLDQPIGTPPLATLARDRRDACIVICDITRPVPNEMILRPLLAILHEAGIPREKITILVATGLHRPNEGEELVEMVGHYIAENYRIVNHHGRIREEHRYLGDTPRGVPVWIDHRYTDADLKITVGLIEPHFMAGFSGGRKLICPGIAGLDTIRKWHGPEFLESPLADSGILDGNPVHEENTLIAKRAGCDFIVNVVIDEYRRPLHFVAGDMEQAFHAGVRFVRDVVTVTLEEPVDIVVTSSAGYPLDTTFYQSVKGMVAALPIIKPGGTIIIAASITEGIGSDDFIRLFQENRDPQRFVQRIQQEDYFVPDQWQLEELARVLRKARVRVITGALSAEQLAELFVGSADSVETALAEALDDYGPDARVAVIPKGPYVLAQLAKK